jgi:acetyl-CoA carboxylase carboxyltransferase component
MEMEKKSPLIREGAAYDTLAKLFDENTFVELGAYVGKAAYAGVVCGYGAVEGALTFAFVQDFSRDKGAFGQAEAKKIVSLYELAAKSGAPVIGVFASAGAKIVEGDVALSAFGSVLTKVTALSGIVPQIAVIDGICAGLNATIASLFDVIVASEKCSFYVNPPFIQKSKGALDAGTAVKALENGLLDIVCEDPIAKAREIISLLPQNNAQGLAYSEAGDDLNRQTPEIADMSATLDIVKALTDCGRFEEWKASCAPEVHIGLAPLGGTTTGIIATDGEGYLTPKAARKISSFLSFCDNYMIPVLTVVDTKGIDPSVDAENAPYASELSRLAASYASSTNAKVTLLVGKAYGAAYTLLGSKAVGADIVLASDKAVISIMEPDAAVQFLYGQDIKTPDDRAAKKAEWLENQASPAAAAAIGDVDDIVESKELRAKIISAFMTLWAKADDRLGKKHSKLPF